jgi:hypothetical protein
MIATGLRECFLRISSNISETSGMPGSITTHSLPALGAITQQLVAYMGAAKESTSTEFTPSPTLENRSD